jgi:hypothetical protein
MRLADRENRMFCPGFFEKQYDLPERSFRLSPGTLFAKN